MRDHFGTNRADAEHGLRQRHVLSHDVKHQCGAEPGKQPSVFRRMPPPERHVQIANREEEGILEKHHDKQHGIAGFINTIPCRKMVGHDPDGCRCHHDGPGEHQDDGFVIDQRGQLAPRGLLQFVPFAIAKAERHILQTVGDDVQPQQLNRGKRHG